MLLSLLAVATPAFGDILELKNGNVLNGKYAGGTAGTVRFDTSSGQQVLPTSQVIALTFTAPPPVAPPANAAAPATSSTVTLPSGTTLLVRMMDSISSRNAPGATFTTKLEYNLVANGVVAVKAGTIIYGKVQSSTQARRALGQSTLDLRLAQIIAGGNPITIATSGYQQAGEASIKKAMGGAAFGAAVGAIADGGDGAAKGAAIGATASLLKKGQVVTIPPGTLLEFSLAQPVTVRIGN